MDNIIYIISVGLIILVLSSAYFLILSKYKTYDSNRLYLILIPIVSLIIPFLSVGITNSGGLIPEVMEQITITGSGINGTPATSTINIWSLITLAYLAGVLIKILKFFYDLRKISIIIKKSTSESIEGIPVYINKSAHDAFTFINKIVVPEKGVGLHVLHHEFYHVQQMHFVDLFLSEMVSIVFWFIPGIHIYKKAVVMNHEFSADQFSGSKGQVDAYCERLLSTAFKIQSFNACHTFNNYSLTKSRIKMMYKKNSSPFRILINYLLVVPFILFAVFIASAKPETLSPDNNSTTSVINEEDVVQPQYPGGKDALYKFMGEHVKFTDAAKAEGKEGTVFVGFIVSASGKVEKVKVLKGVSEELNNEAMRVVRLMPDWIPGTKDGKKVIMEMTLPIKFVLK